MHPDDATLLGALLRDSVRNRGIVAILLVDEPNRRGMTYEQVRAVEIAWPGYTEGGVLTDNTRVGEALATDDGVTQLTIIGPARFVNLSNVPWRMSKGPLYIGYYWGDSPNRRLLWYNEVRLPGKTVQPGETLVIPPVIMT